MEESKSFLTKALKYLRRGDFSQVESLCLQVLQHEPENARAWHLCGIVHARQNKLERATECFENAVEFDASVANYHYNLGLAYRKLKRFDDAINAYRAAIERKANFLEAHNNLGNTLIEKGDVGEGIECFRNLVEQFPDCSIGYYNLGNVLQDAGKLEDSIAQFYRAIEWDPDFSSARENLGRTFCDVKRYEEAIQVWNLWLEHDPNNAVARHMIASVTGENTPVRCDDDYVRETFHKDFARMYEQQLAHLEYKVPGLIGDAIKSLNTRLVDLYVLDAGCGTGLCSPVLRPLARRLVGVDLSSAMLVEAEKRKTYDELLEDELTRYLVSQPSSYDLIVSGDTLCYFGDLNEVCVMTFQCLRDNGFMIFTVECNKSTDEDQRYELQPNGRYQHAEPYIRRTLTESGFAVLRTIYATLRLERGRAVEGLVVIAQRWDRYSRVGPD